MAGWLCVEGGVVGYTHTNTKASLPLSHALSSPNSYRCRRFVGGRLAIAIHRGRVGTRPQQHSHYAPMPARRRPHQRRGLAALGARVDVDGGGR